MKEYKFLNKNYHIDNNIVFHDSDSGNIGTNVYENMAIGLVSWCQRMEINPLSYTHQFYDDGDFKEMKIQDVLIHTNFECPHVMIQYQIYNRNEDEELIYNFHLRQDDFNEIMRRYENI